MTRFNHTMIFFKLTDQNKISDIYINHTNCLGHYIVNYIVIIKSIIKFLSWILITYAPPFILGKLFLEKTPLNLGL